MLDAYVVALAAAPLAAQTRRTYASKVRQYLAWLALAETDGDPLNTADGRDWAVRDYRTHLQAVLKRRPATVNSALAAIDDLYIRRHLGAASAARLELPATARAPSASATSCATCEPSKAAPRRATKPSRSPRSTPAHGSARSSASTSTTSASPPAREPCGSTAKANESATSRSIHNYAPRSPAGSTNAPDGPVLRSLRPSFSTSAGNA